jgi:hypothetical protein
VTTNTPRPEADEVRQRADAIAEKARNDPAFKEKLETYPIDTLRSEGFEMRAASEFLRDAGQTVPAGAQLPAQPACFCTGCCCTKSFG